MIGVFRFDNRWNSLARRARNLAHSDVTNLQNMFTRRTRSGTATSWSRDLATLGANLDSLAIQQAAAELRNSGPNAAGSLLAGIVQAASTVDFEP